jgi:hypothetical protein
MLNGAAKPLFQTYPYYGLFTANLFDVTADGQRFILDYDKGRQLGAPYWSPTGRHC